MHDDKSINEAQQDMGLNYHSEASWGSKALITRIFEL